MNKLYYYEEALFIYGRSIVVFDGNWTKMAQ